MILQTSSKWWIEGVLQFSLTHSATIRTLNRWCFQNAHHYRFLWPWDILVLYLSIRNISITCSAYRLAWSSTQRLIGIPVGLQTCHVTLLQSWCSYDITLLKFNMEPQNISKPNAFGKSTVDVDLGKSVLSGSNCCRFNFESVSFKSHYPPKFNMSPPKVVGKMMFFFPKGGICEFPGE